ncbi:AMP-binding protein [Euzebya sp.]|uniref:AMP-binding protein n=1 Tax=Euzebya sp. TaxID=1971409 RepID=UPI0035177819
MVDVSPNRLISTAIRAGQAAQNALEVARFGGLETGDEPSPFDVVGRTPVYRLRHYFPELGGQGRPPVLLVPPLMLTAEVYDVAPATSGVAALSEMGIDPWVVDFGAPEREEGGLERDLADHVLAVGDAIDRVVRATGSDVHLAGYSQGGMFCYQSCAFRRGEGITSLITWGSPVDIHLLSPAGLPVARLADAAATLADVVLSRTSVPAGLSKRIFQLLDPLKTARQRLQFILQLHNREALLEREGSRRFLEDTGWVAWPGPAVAEFARQFISHNRMIQGGFVIDGRPVTVADIDTPTLAVIGTSDEIAAAPAVRAIRRAAPQAEIWELALDSGHMGLVVGHGARESSWTVVADWVHWQEGTGDRPDAIVELTEQPEAPADPSAGVQVATDIAVGAAHLVAGSARNATKAVRGVLSEAVDQLPRLARLERVDADTRVSLALLLDERARRHPDETFFLFGGRAYSYADSLHRIDAVTRGLVSVGVRQGEHVGVLMATRPTALAVLAALSRLGAVAVMLRPDGDLRREMRLGQVGRVIADPAHAAQADGHGDAPLLVLGTGGRDGELPDGAVDMEQIDHEAVALPGWYEPNPGRARDLALVSFTGRGGATRANRITNRRWAMSAFGTASAASLGLRDTVYAVTPLHHPATLLTAIGGAVVSGARLAVAPRFDADTFWEEVRRYGVTVVSYTWAMCRDLLQAPPTAAERHHPIRLFIGSGMPTGLWHRVQDRFRPARVLEFYAPTEGDVVLANVRGGKVGAKGRPLPGTARVALGAYDVDRGVLVTGADGFVQEPAVGEVGMLLARVGRERTSVRGRVLRGVFAKGDAWLSTGDLFCADADGDLWLLGRPSTLIRTRDGHVPPFGVEAALESVDAVDLAVAYGVRPEGSRDELVVAAVTARDGEGLSIDALLAGLSAVEAWQWPSVIRVVDDVPLSLHHRPQKAPLQDEGIPSDAEGWWWDEDAGRYRPLDATAAATLMS